MPLLPRSRRRAARQAGEPAPVVVPSRRRRWPAAPEALTDVHQPDAVQLIAHPAPTVVSTQADLELQVLQLVEELHARDALDRYTATVVDGYVDSRIAADLELIDREAASARATNGGLLLSAEVGNLTDATVRLGHLREADQRLTAEIAAHRAELLGDRLGAADPAADRGAAPLAVYAIPRGPAPADLRPAAPADAATA
ncbi:hypothetical protein [Trujillonella humicola]|uniref:hypothetical protein n=1 Tax=Trujillonella humicola TaxID=3383699 RepID=UPI0039064412